ncbi:FAD dependent oxidoreductase [Chitinophaga polysaccharea]|uniref:FAD dependent oxidoreductase n=1 Tax=Chitinophaga polysaccharea TaxID=1293035 RepID=A0A561PQG9_9BACT|nr:FAD-dependent oxidoreductase [Chitinophaga polysaccharea]TWF40366.1 FAD dependent oxidoreductase [Chitinophaga polysaccharea]
MSVINYAKDIQVKGIYDVIVVGSGSAGSTAAIAAARLGAKTLLIERLPFLGGISTAVLDTFYGYYTPGKQSTKIVGGIADDVVRELCVYNACFERPNTFGAGTGITYHPEYLKVVWETLAVKAGCHILLNAWVQDVVKEDGRITGLIVATKLGLTYYRAKQFVDATGDADLIYLAGFDYEQAGEQEPAQTLTTTFKMVNVDTLKRKAVSKEEFHQLMKQAAESNDYDLPRKEGSDHITPVDGMTATIMTRLKSYQKIDSKTINATDPEFLSKAEIKGRLQALEYIRFLRDCVPGYENASLSTFGMQIGVRETRRIYGEYRLTEEDVLSARQFDDQIGLCGAPMEDHHDGEDTKWKYLPEGKTVGIPYRTLIPKNTKNVLVAGRCFSASHVAHSSVRSMAQCMVMGQAAGIASALCAEKNISPVQLDAGLLKERLLQQGGIINEP